MLDKWLRRDKLIYKSLFDDEGNEVIKRNIIFITATEDGEVESMTTGKPLAVNKTGYVYVVDDVVVKNIDKFEIKGGQLELKEGERIEEPVKSELEIEEEELLKRISEIQAQKNADTEEQTDEPTAE